MKAEAADPYATLGLAWGASPDEIRRAFRRLAALHHPDRHGGSPEAEARFKLISAAFQRLKQAGWSLPRPTASSPSARAATPQPEPAAEPDEVPYERPEFWPDGARIHYPTPEEIAALLRDEPALFPWLRAVYDGMGYALEYVAWFVVIASGIGLVGIMVWFVIRALMS